MSGQGPRSRRRGDDLIQAIHAAALAEVAEVGIGGITMEGIARRAATAKTSLYRRWPSPRELLLDALHDAHPQEEPSPGADDLRGDLIRALRQLTDWLSTPAARAVAEIMMDRHRYPDLAGELFTRVFDPRGGTVTQTVLRHYAARGLFDPELITPVVADIGEALVIKYSTDNARFPDDDALGAIVDQAILPAVGVVTPGRPDATGTA